MTRYLNPNIFRRENIAPCPLCLGRGSLPNVWNRTMPTRCPACEGTGKHAYKLKELLAAWQDGKRLSDLLPRVYGYISDRAALSTFTQQLSKHGSPWAVTNEKGSRSVLWKIDETLRTKEQQEKERRKRGVRWFKEGDNRNHKSKETSEHAGPFALGYGHWKHPRISARRG